jgi:hypothetical protein
MDDKKDWQNNIFHNSRYAIFAIHSDKVELLSKGTNMPKFRKSKVTSEAKVAQKIVTYCLYI